MARHLRRLVALLALLGLALFVAAPNASAHGGGETEEGYLLVQQALAHLAHDTSATGIALAMEKVEDALATDDQEGVAVPQVKQGMAALEQGEVGTASRLLRRSISEALASLPPATGTQTGTTDVPPELKGRPDLRAQDWALLAASTAVLSLGVALAWLFRPQDSVRSLRSRLGTPGDPAAAPPREGS